MDISDVRRIKQKFIDCNPISWWGDHIDVRFHLLSELMKLRGKRILDVGCNNGILLSEIEENNECYGLDVSPKYVITAKNTAPKSRIRIASMYCLPYEGNFFDVVIWANVVPGSDFFEPIEKVNYLRERALSETLRVLKREGEIYLTTPNNVRYRSNKLSYRELAKIIQRFNNVQICGWNPLPDFPYFLPARVLAKIPGMFKLLTWMMNRNILIDRCKMFYVRASK